MAEERIPVLETRKLGISFGGLKAVSEFNIKIYPGELVGLIGPNGAGKTTVFNLLTGVYVPTEGTVLLNGQPLNGKKTHQFVAAGVARTFQNIRLFKEMSVIENVKVACTKDICYGLFAASLRTPKFWKAEKAITEKAMSLLEICNLADVADLPAASLPYGRQRKLEIARALATDMKVLLLDEPAAGMNPTETAELLECINTIRDRFGIAILLIEHDMSLVMNVCERIQVLDYGMTIAAGTPAEVAITIPITNMMPPIVGTPTFSTPYGSISRLRCASVLCCSPSPLAPFCWMGRTCRRSPRIRSSHSVLPMSRKGGTSSPA